MIRALAYPSLGTVSVGVQRRLNNEDLLALLRLLTSILGRLLIEHRTSKSSTSSPAESTWELGCLSLSLERILEVVGGEHTSRGGAWLIRVVGTPEEPCPSRLCIGAVSKEASCTLLSRVGVPEQSSS